MRSPATKSIEPKGRHRGFRAICLNASGKRLLVATVVFLVVYIPLSTYVTNWMGDITPMDFIYVG